MDRAAAPPLQELHAPGAWATLEFISDLHLQATEPATFEAWRRYMAECGADALFILGDLFEVWVGDDEASEPGFAADCAKVLHEASRRRPVFFMHGNRDFLVGSDLLAGCGVTLLADPTVLGFAGARWLLTHGDALCLEDTGYLRFREQVRSADWQRQFLAQPLAQRQQIARGLREQSEAVKQEAQTYADVDSSAARGWLDAADARVMVHGHTHRPGEYTLGEGRTRVVLSDWDAAARPTRLEALRLDAAGWRRVPLG